MAVEKTYTIALPCSTASNRKIGENDVSGTIKNQNRNFF